MTTGMLAAWGSPFRSLREFRGGSSQTILSKNPRDFRLQSSIPDVWSVQSEICILQSHLAETTEYSANGSFIFHFVH